MTDMQWRRPSYIAEWKDKASKEQLAHMITLHSVQVLMFGIIIGALIGFAVGRVGV